MNLRWSRLLWAALAAEATPVALLIAYVFVAGPREPAAAADFAASAGAWFGPIVGGLVTLLIAWFIARRAGTEALRYGLTLGVLVAVLDATILILGGTPFRWLYVLSGAGRVAAGALGGWVAARSVS